MAQAPALRVVSAPNRAWSPVQAWAYALGAPYHVQHGLPVDALPRPGEAVRTDMAALCRRDWSIEGAEDLLRTLNWLGWEGHRATHRFRIRQYCLIRRPAIAARREELREAGQEDAGALNELWRLDAVQADWRGVRGGVFLSFDAARATMLVRCGLVLGWLEEAAAWRYLTDMAADVQQSFGSWAEYAADFKLSRAFWSGRAQPDTFDTIADLLLADRQSPWRRLPWAVGLAVPRPPALPGSEPVWSLEA